MYQSRQFCLLLLGLLQVHALVDVFQARINTANAGNLLARTAYLSSLDYILQENRATWNNILGQLLPQNIIPLMTGPVIDNPSAGGAWGNAVGSILSWDLKGFRTLVQKMEQGATR